MKPKTSEEFTDAFISSGSPVADCEFCGRTHFDSNGEFMDEGELEGLQRKLNREPGKYISRNGTIRHGVIDGKQAVYGCECNGLAELEGFIWENRRIIAKYLKARTHNEFVRAEREKIIAGEL